MRATWFSARALRLHLMLVLVAGGCIALGWWQLTRALSGNSLSWVYTFEWPFFAAYAGYMWWRLVHEAAAEARASAGEPAPRRVHEPASPSVAARVDELDFDPYDDSDPELAAYNRYLASLHASSGPPPRSRTRRMSTPRSSPAENAS